MDEFERLVAAIDYPLFIVTTSASGGERSGCVVGFATQCSIDPPRFLVALSEKNHTFGVARTATHLAVHVLDRREKNLAELFGGQTGDEVDKFAACEWHDGPHDMPILDRIDAWFVGRIVERVELGDHLGHVLEPVAAKAAARENLQYGEARDIQAGHPADE
ncbi:MAG TPA: flavin reductase family protein [Acidimicrobiales bacterium]|nr:flavin reductase family protein [Acidimicrobiales bacterium]